MKLRCAYCNHEFSEPCRHCPACGRVLKLPAALRKRSLAERNKAREKIARQAEKQRRQAGPSLPTGRRSPLGIFAVLMILLIAGGALLLRVNQVFAPPRPRTREDIARKELFVLRIALERFRIDQGRYPTEEEGLQALIRDPGTVTNWQRHYVTLIKPDPWRQEYHYERLPDGGVRVRSSGPDRILHTAADLIVSEVSDEAVAWPPEE